MMLIIIDEEYGYRTWLWRYPHDKKQLIEDWKAGKAPLNFYDPSFGTFDGKLTRLKGTWPRKGGPSVVLSQVPFIEARTKKEARELCDADAHVHDADDTELVFRHDDEDEKYVGAPNWTIPPLDKKMVDD